MADNVEITAGAGTPVATEDRGGTHFQRVIDTGAESGVSGQDTTVGATVESIAARAKRREIGIQAAPTNAQNILIGFTDATCFIVLAPGQPASFPYAGELFYKAAAGSDQTINYWEVYD